MVSKNNQIDEAVQESYNELAEKWNKSPLGELMILNQDRLKHLVKLKGIWDKLPFGWRMLTAFFIFPVTILSIGIKSIFSFLLKTFTIAFVMAMFVGNDIKEYRHRNDD